MSSTMMPAMDPGQTSRSGDATSAPAPGSMAVSMPAGMAMPTTFAQLLATRTGVTLAAPPVVDRPRVDQAALSAADRQRFVDALNAVNLPDQTGISALGRMVAIHADMMTHRMHAMGGDPSTDPGQQRFLPWHRVYLFEFEQLLQTVHPEITVPYWDWTNADEQNIPDWLRAVRPTVNIPNPGPGTVTVTRAPGTFGFDLAAVISGDVDPSIASLAVVEQASDFTSFASGLESIHDLVHTWVGGQNGTMSQLDRAPADPLFWLHHANIDRLWWQWQNSPQGKDQNPNLTGLDAIMDPWAFNEPATRDLATFHYSYA